ncbi:MAG: hypothetical protein IJT88_10590 [Kiritimatiellae bacterium]|nr:hypothetical protein [Kiritimatiellia bacterium]
MNTDPVNPNPSASARRVFVSAGEASGDAHAARLLRALPPEIRGTTDFYGIGGDALRALENDRPAALLTVDYPGFNLRLAAAAHRLGIPVCHYISPQVWAWNRGRIPKIARILDLLMVIFPFETEVFGGMVEVHDLPRPVKP